MNNTIIRFFFKKTPAGKIILPALLCAAAVFFSSCENPVTDSAIHKPEHTPSALSARTAPLADFTQEKKEMDLKASPNFSSFYQHGLVNGQPVIYEVTLTQGQKLPLSIKDAEGNSINVSFKVEKKVYDGEKTVVSDGTDIVEVTANNELVAKEKPSTVYVTLTADGYRDTELRVSVPRKLELLTPNQDDWWWYQQLKKYGENKNGFKENPDCPAPDWTSEDITAMLKLYDGIMEKIGNVFSDEDRNVRLPNGVTVKLKHIYQVFAMIKADHPDLAWIGYTFALGNSKDTEGAVAFPENVAYEGVELYARFSPAEQLEAQANIGTQSRRTANGEAKARLSFEDAQKKIKEESDALIRELDLNKPTGQLLVDIEAKIREKIRYENTQNVELSALAWNRHSIYDAFIEKKCVCDGYSATYSYLIKKIQKEHPGKLAGVFCTAMAGNSSTGQSGGHATHSWNLLRIADKWYETDITYIDTYNDQISRYFNTQTDEHTFAGNHKRNTTHISNVLAPIAKGTDYSYDEIKSNPSL